MGVYYKYYVKTKYLFQVPKNKQKSSHTAGTRKDLKKKMVELVLLTPKCGQKKKRSFLSINKAELN